MYFEIGNFKFPRHQNLLSQGNSKNIFKKEAFDNLKKMIKLLKKDKNRPFNAVKTIVFRFLDKIFDKNEAFYTSGTDI